jgi:hypothetical protein
MEYVGIWGLKSWNLGLKEVKVEIGLVGIHMSRDLWGIICVFLYVFLCFFLFLMGSSHTPHAAHPAHPRVPAPPE